MYSETDRSAANGAATLALQVAWQIGLPGAVGPDVRHMHTGQFAVDIDDGGDHRRQAAAETMRRRCAKPQNRRGQLEPTGSQIGPYDPGVLRRLMVNVAGGLDAPLHGFDGMDSAWRDRRHAGMHVTVEESICDQCRQYRAVFAPAVAVEEQALVLALSDRQRVSATEQAGRAPIVTLTHCTQSAGDRGDVHHRCGGRSSSASTERLGRLLPGAFRDWVGAGTSVAELDVLSKAGGGTDGNTVGARAAQPGTLSRSIQPMISITGI
jgi:hypothetical protein